LTLLILIREIYKKEARRKVIFILYILEENRKRKDQKVKEERRTENARYDAVVDAINKITKRHKKLIV